MSLIGVPLDQYPSWYGVSAYHPYECQDGCVHCARQFLPDHDPYECAQCDEQRGESWR